MIRLPHNLAHDIFTDIMSVTTDPTLAGRLENFAQRRDGVLRIQNALISATRVMLLMKTGMPDETDNILLSAAGVLNSSCADSCLRDLAMVFIDIDAATPDQADIFRDRRVVTDNLFEERIKRLKACLLH